MSLSEKKFGVLPDGAPVQAYTLQNEAGASLTILSFGARIQSLQMPDRRGKLGEMVLGHNTLDGYLAAGDYQGATVGRYASRIANGTFSIDGHTYSLPCNEAHACLHGGQGFSHRLWRFKCCDNSDDAPSMTLAYTSEDGEDGFPGKCRVTVTFCLTTDNALMIDYKAKTDQPTVLNLTNHSFFNLSGNCHRDVLSTEVSIDANAFTPVDTRLLPTGEILSVAGTPLDFRKFKTIGQDIRHNFLRNTNGYDHNYVLNGNGYRKVAQAYNQSTGRRLLVFTDQPGMQFYTANAFGPNDRNRDGSPMKPHTAFCFETQHYPDSPNHPDFPSTLLRPGETFFSRTVFKFETVR